MDMGPLDKFARGHIKEAEQRGRELEQARVSDGWLYHNPDTGEEWSENHPVESGEVPDAENVRPATATAFQNELIPAWEEIERLNKEIAVLSKKAKDTERLDWLARQFKTGTVYMSGDCTFAPNHRVHALKGRNFRDSIDAAMKDEK